jgi:hypothetical protein
MDNQKAIQTVVSKAWDDPKFLADLVASPKAAIAASTGVKIPDDVDIVVNDMTDARKVYINIPPKPDYDNMELTDEQLEEVSGGFITSGLTVALIVTAVAPMVLGVAAGAVDDQNLKNKAAGKKHW